MLIRNTDQELVNGSVGCVTSFAARPKAVKEGSPTTELTEDDPSATLYPVVLFRLCDGRTREMLVLPQMFTVETPAGEVRASRSQVSALNMLSLSLP